MWRRGLVHATRGCIVCAMLKGVRAWIKRSLYADGCLWRGDFAQSPRAKRCALAIFLRWFRTFRMIAHASWFFAKNLGKTRNK